MELQLHRASDLTEDTLKPRLHVLVLVFKLEWCWLLFRIDCVLFRNGELGFQLETFKPVCSMLGRAGLFVVGG